MKSLIRCYVGWQAVMLTIKICFPASMSWFTTFLPILAPIILLNSLILILLFVFVVMGS